MSRLTRLWNNAETRRFGSLAAAVTVLAARPAAAQGLQKAQGILETLQQELTTIVPVVAAIILLCLGVAYAGRFIEKDTFVRWAIGVIIAGSAVQITSMLFT